MSYSIEEAPKQMECMCGICKLGEREWVGLTDFDVEGAFYHAEYDTTFSYQLQPAEWCKAFAQHLESQLRSKNA